MAYVELPPLLLRDAGPTSSEQEESEEESCADQIEDLSECTEVTIGDLEACSQAQFTLMDEMFRTLSEGTCADIEAAAGSEDDEGLLGMNMFPEMEDIPECADLPTKCPPMAPSEAETETTSGPGSDALPIDTPEDAGDGEEDEGEPSDPVPADSSEP